MDKDRLPEKESELSTQSLPVKMGLLLVISLLMALVCSFFIILVHSFFTDKEWGEMVKEHTPAAIGIPFAVMAAFLIVSVLQVTSGKIEFEAIGFKFSGASGPVVLWIACFIVFVSAIKLLW